MKRAFVSCIKQYVHVQLSYGCLGMPVVGRMCLYCAEKKIKYKMSLTKKYWNKNEKHLKNEQKVGMLL